MALDLPISAAYPQRTVRCPRGRGRLSRHWLEMSLVVQGACPPNITWPKLTVAVVWLRSPHGVHHRRYAALGRLDYLLIGLLRRLPYLRWLL